MSLAKTGILGSYQNVKMSNDKTLHTFSCFFSLQGLCNDVLISQMQPYPLFRWNFLHLINIFTQIRNENIDRLCEDYIAKNVRNFEVLRNHLSYIPNYCQQYRGGCLSTGLQRSNSISLTHFLHTKALLYALLFMHWSGTCNYIVQNVLWCHMLLFLCTHLQFLYLYTC